MRRFDPDPRLHSFHLASGGLWSEMKWLLLCLVSVSILAAHADGSPSPYGLPQDNSSRKPEKASCQKETCATVVGQVDTRSIPEIPSAGFLIEIYPIHGEVLAYVFASPTDERFRLPPVPYGTYQIFVTSHENCQIKWMGTVRLRPSQTKRIHPRPRIDSTALCE